jgi:micrococcal nuclease
MIAAVLAAALLCTAPHVHDGDTIRCAGASVRIANMDAPEMPGSPRCRAHPGWACDPAAEAFAIPARDRMIALTRGKVRCDPQDTDRYGRTVARCFAGRVDVGRQLVREGLARDYVRFSHGAYLKDETRARAQHLGMWR